MKDLLNTQMRELYTDNGEMPEYAFPGGYPVYYLDKQNNVICGKCATDAVKEFDSEKENYCDIGELPASFGINYEDNALTCDGCGEQIEYAYGGETND